MKRRAFSLIEIAVALPLIAILFSFLLLTLTKSIRSNDKLEKKEKIALENHYFQRRLQQRLAHVTKQKDLKRDLFHIEKAVFYFNNGISLDPKAKGELKAKLFLENQSLKLHLYQVSKAKEIFVREEELLTNVESLKIDYFFEKKNSENEEGLAPYQIVKNPDKVDDLTWVALNLHLGIEGQKKIYFFNLKRPGV